MLASRCFANFLKSQSKWPIITWLSQASSEVFWHAGHATTPGFAGGAVEPLAVPEGSWRVMPKFSAAILAFAAFKASCKSNEGGKWVWVSVGRWIWVGHGCISLKYLEASNWVHNELVQKQKTVFIFKSLWRHTFPWPSVTAVTVLSSSELPATIVTSNNTKEQEHAQQSVCVWITFQFQ